MRGATAVSCVIFLWVADARAQSLSVREAPATQLEEFVVTGEQPGPGLWKISKGDHVLWILGTHTPLPEKMKWRSREVEAIVRQSQEILGGRQFSTGLQGLDGDRLVRERTRNAKDATLEDILPKEVFRRFSMLHEKYAQDGKNLEFYRPFAAVQELYKEALQSSRLSSDSTTERTVRRLARRYSVKYRRIEVRDDRPKETAAEFAAITQEAELACVNAWMDRFESDLREAKKRANAWAVGNMDSLLADVTLREPLQTSACAQFFTRSPRVKRGVAYVEQLWGEALETALAKNRATLALEPLSSLFGPGGLIDRFNSKGYDVQFPSATGNQADLILAATAAGSGAKRSASMPAANASLVAIPEISDVEPTQGPPADLSCDRETNSKNPCLDELKVTAAKERPAVEPDDCVAFTSLYSAGGFRKFDWQALDERNLVIWLLKNRAAYHIRLSLPIVDMMRLNRIDFAGDTWLCGSGKSVAGEKGTERLTLTSVDGYGIKRPTSAGNVHFIRLLNDVKITQLEEQYRIDLSFLRK